MLHHEIFATRAYFRNGISLPERPVVLDVGANIGMFGVYLALHHPGARVHLLEPVPETFALLERNLAPYGGRAELRPHRLALGDRRGTLDMLLDPAATFAATAEPEAVAASHAPGATPERWAEALLQDLPRVYPGLLGRWAARCARLPALRRPLVRGVAAGVRHDARRRAERLRRVQAPVTRLSDFLRDQQIERVHLLKVDVEGSEGAVLAGIDEADWPRIEQLVVEVHDAAGRAESLRAMLAERGYIATLEAEDWAVHRLLGITTLFARRPAPALAA